MSLESNSVVDLNVGGLLYTTSVDTLTKVRLIISINVQNVYNKFSFYSI